MPPGEELIGSHARYSFPVAFVDVAVLGSNERRVALVIGAPSAGIISVRFGDASATTVDIRVSANTLPWVVTIDEIGTLIRQAVHIITNTGGANGGVIEVSKR